MANGRSTTDLTSPALWKPCHNWIHILAHLRVQSPTATTYATHSNFNHQCQCFAFQTNEYILSCPARTMLFPYAMGRSAILCAWEQIWEMNNFLSCLISGILKVKPRHDFHRQHLPHEPWTSHSMAKGAIKLYTYNMLATSNAGNGRSILFPPVVVSTQMAYTLLLLLFSNFATTIRFTVHKNSGTVWMIAGAGGWRMVET